jgi:hypothetical protein
MEDIETLFDDVWRTDFSHPGFVVRELPSDVDSHSLRSRMIELKLQLSSIAQSRTGDRFIALSLGRFDQQVTTRFHLDGAPERSLLMLGYEPSEIRSRLLLADYARVAFERGITPGEFLRDFNPMFSAGADLLAGSVSEVPPQPPGMSRIVLINNSALPFSATDRHPLGVLHQAEILNPDPSRSRIVNSMMLTVTREPESAEEHQRDAEFIATTHVSPNLYS